MLALGHCSLDNCALLPDELKALQEECTADRKARARNRWYPTIFRSSCTTCFTNLSFYASILTQRRQLLSIYLHLQSKQTRMRHSEIKVAIGHVLRLLVSSLPPGTLQADTTLRSMILDYISSTYRYLSSAASGAQTACADVVIESMNSLMDQSTHFD